MANHSILVLNSQHVFKYSLSNTAAWSMALGFKVWYSIYSCSISCACEVKLEIKIMLADKYFTTYYKLLRHLDCESHCETVKVWLSSITNPSCCIRCTGSENGLGHQTNLVSASEGKNICPHPTWGLCPRSVFSGIWSLCWKYVDAAVIWWILPLCSRAFSLEGHLLNVWFLLAIPPPGLLQCIKKHRAMLKVSDRATEECYCPHWSTPMINHLLSCH